MVPMFSAAGVNQGLPKASTTAHASTTLFRLLPAARPLKKASNGAQDGRGCNEQRGPRSGQCADRRVRTDCKRALHLQQATSKALINPIPARKGRSVRVGQKSDACSGPDSSAHVRVLRTEAWSRLPTLSCAGFQAENEKRVVLIPRPACRRSIVGCTYSFA
jgi:hypothetical protein